MPTFVTVAAFAACGISALLFLLLGVRHYLRQPREEKEEAPSVALRAVAGGGKPGSTAKQLQDRLVRAGIYTQESVDLFYTVRMTVLGVGVVLAAIAGFVVGNVGGAALLCSAVVALAVLAPGWWLDQRSTARQLALSRALPNFLDLLVICLDAGLSLEQSLLRIVSRATAEGDVLRSELAITLGEMQAGVPTATAFRKFAARVGSEDANSLAVAIAGATQLGASITEVLRGYALNLRQSRLTQLDEGAGKASARISLPLAVCLLPAILILLVGPAGLLLYRSF